MLIDPLKIKPLKDAVLIKCDKRNFETITSGGVILPANVGQLAQTVGEVVSVGPGRLWTEGPWKGKFIPTYLQPGDLVLFALEGSEPIQTSDSDYHYEFLKSEIYVLGTI